MSSAISVSSAGRIFIPAAFTESHVSFPNREAAAKARVTGIVVYINHNHGWFRVAYDTAAGTQHECFKMN